MRARRLNSGAAFVPFSVFYVDDKSAALYDAALAPLERGFLRRWRAETMAVLPPEAQWLEVGAGTGLNFAHYPEGARGVASEPSGAMIRKARDQRNRPAGVQLVQSIVERLPFADDSFDAALATLVFCSVASPRDAFTELRRVVRPGAQSHCLSMCGRRERYWGRFLTR